MTLTWAQQMVLADVRGEIEFKRELNEAKRMFTGSREREPVPLSSGEILLIRRALRVYANTEQQAIHNAVVAIKKPKDKLHAADVKQHAQKHIDAAEALLDYLRTWKTQRT